MAGPGVFGEEPIPHFYVESVAYSTPLRAGLCNVTGQTNERSLLAAVLPEGMPAVDTVPTVGPSDPEISAVWTALANSFVADFLIRQKISTHLSYFYVEAMPLIRPGRRESRFRMLFELSARLSTFTPEIQLAEPARDLRERARLAPKSTPSSPDSTTSHPLSSATS